MAESREDLEGRARWCRRLAGDCRDKQLESSLQQIAVELEKRASDLDDQR